ncbi:MAG: hypothetical protein GY760_14290 [Deltaproteobacteria bacterium]|nr:hypothetical protein [Deltaproteobacteria bacterium]
MEIFLISIGFVFFAFLYLKDIKDYDEKENNDNHNNTTLELDVKDCDEKENTYKQKMNKEKEAYPLPIEFDIKINKGILFIIFIMGVLLILTINIPEIFVHFTAYILPIVGLILTTASICNFFSKRKVKFKRDGFYDTNFNSGQVIPWYKIVKIDFKRGRGIHASHLKFLKFTFRGNTPDHYINITFVGSHGHDRLLLTLRIAAQLQPRMSKSKFESD